MAERVSQGIRGTDTVARIGGDEFAVLLEGIGTLEQAIEAAGAIRQTLKQPLELAGTRVSISASIGLALYPQHGNDERQLFDYADTQMYAEKRYNARSGQNTYGNAR